jgi:hypothetical protein
MGLVGRLSPARDQAKWRSAVPANPEKAPQVTPVPPAAPAPAADHKLEPGELTDEDLDKVSGGFAPQVSAGRIPSGSNPLL